MASIDELIALIEDDIGKSDSANASIEASRAEAEELAGLFTAMNVDGQAARTEQVQQALTEALAQGPAIRAKLEEARARAEALKTQGPGGSADQHPTSSAPKRSEMVGGDELLEQAKSRGSKFGQFTRALTESAEDVGQLSKKTTDTGFSIMKSRNPNPPVEVTHSGTEQPRPIIDAVPNQQAPVGDFIATGVMLGAVTTTFIRNMRQRRERARDDD